jgi:hypothetical protein
MASTYLSRTPSSTGNRKTFTWSAWVKRANLTRGFLFFAWDGSTYTDSSMLNFSFNSNNALQVETGATNLRTTNQLFRDTSAWYHIVFSCDTTQATASDRLKLYVNGSEITSFSDNNNVSQNNDMGWNHTFLARIGSSNGSHYFDGSMSHIHFCDGTAYDASAFGETDATTGEWKIKTSPSVTYGTNGFFILKDGNSVTDQSGNSNNFTVGGGTLTNTEDNPSNVFATLNPLASNTGNLLSFSNGNLTSTSTSAFWESVTTTIGASQGKWYAEYKYVSTSSGELMPGIVDIATYMNDANKYGGVFARGYTYYNNGNKANNNVFSSYGNSYAVGDIIGVAMDLDNHKIYFSKNGTWQNSGDPTSGSTGTGSAFNLATGYTYGFMASNKNSVHSWNFGNGYFGTTAVSSAGTNASGNGIFEYDVPTGYTALSTKGLNL